VATFVATSHELLRLWLYLPLQAEAVASCHDEFKNDLITEHEKQESLTYRKTNNQQDAVVAPSVDTSQSRMAPSAATSQSYNEGFPC